MAQATWYHPQSMAQALKVLHAHPKQCVVVGGATSLALRKDNLPPHIIDISGCNLAFIRVLTNVTTIGAVTRLADLVPASLPGVSGAFIAKVASGIATTPLRNMITIGGNIAQCHPWSQMPVALLALDATIQVRSTQSRRRIKATTFFSQVSNRIIRPTEFITQIEFPNYKEGEAAFGFEQIRRTATDYPLISVAVFLTQKNGLINSARIVVGSTKSRPVFVMQPSGMMLGKAIDDIDIDMFSNRVAKDLPINTDPRASIDYKQEMAVILCRRALTTALAGLSK